MIGARYIPKCGDLIGLNNIPLFALTPKKKNSKMIYLIGVDFEISN